MFIQASTQRHSPAVATVIVNIVDINDNGPLFERGPYIGEVLENSLVGTTVMQVSANDKDSVRSDLKPNFVVLFLAPYSSGVNLQEWVLIVIVLTFLV